MAHHILEKISYVSVIIAATVVTGSTLSRWHENALTAKPASELAAPQLQGQQLPLKGIDWKHHKATVVLALNTGCHFCTASVPFYRRLVSLKNDSGSSLELVAVFPQAKREGERYLSGKNVAISAVMSVPLEDIMVEGTPTMMLVGPDGVVRRSWKGYLDENQQQSAITDIKKVTES